MHASIGFLLFTGAVGVLVSAANGAANSSSQDLYVLNDQDEPVKLTLTPSPQGLKGVDEEELPNRVFFYLYTRATKNSPETLKVDDTSSVKRSHFDSTKPTKIVTHGWQSSSQHKICTAIRDAFLKHSDCNVILVDWNSISKFEYVWTSNQVLKVAKFVASMINFLYSQGMRPSTTTVVGHSLGAHVAGLSSYYAKNIVSYAVALDPAGPNFESKGQNDRVTRADANYVQVIHTTNTLGMSSQIGHVDFYPNGGTSQVGCGADMGWMCSHGRAHEYFAESINSNRFVARMCSNYVDFKNGKCNSNPIARMGGAAADFSARGQYYLDTNSNPPYAKN